MLTRRISPSSEPFSKLRTGESRGGIIQSNAYPDEPDIWQRYHSPQDKTTKTPIGALHEYHARISIEERSVRAYGGPEAMKPS